MKLRSGFTVNEEYTYTPYRFNWQPFEFNELCEKYKKDPKPEYLTWICESIVLNKEVEFNKYFIKSILDRVKNTEYYDVISTVKVFSPFLKNF